MQTAISDNQVLIIYQILLEKKWMTANLIKNIFFNFQNILLLFLSKLPYRIKYEILKEFFAITDVCTIRKHLL